MTQPLMRNELRPKIAGLEAWGDCEYILRKAIDRHLASQRWEMHSALACTQLTLSLYKQRGLTITHEALCPSYDLLRHGRPIDFDLLYEARTTQALIARAYGSAKPITKDKLDPWLREMIVLANTIGSYEESGTAGLGVPGGLGTPLGGSLAQTPFKLPPGALDALRSEIRANLEALPPLLSITASIAALSDFTALYPTSLSLAQRLLLPGLVSLAFQRPVMAVRSSPNHRIGLTLEELRESALQLGQDFEEAEAKYRKGLDALGSRRTGSLLPRVLVEILRTPLFTSKSVALQIGCTSRTVEKLALDLEAGGQITALQRSGRLVLWALK